MRSIGQWAREGVCREQYNTFDTSPRKAKRLCRTCPVRAECLLYALVYGEKGIWGGTDDEQRQAITNSNAQFRQTLIKQALDQGLYETRYSIAHDFDFAVARQSQAELLAPLGELSIQPEF